MKEHFQVSKAELMKNKLLCSAFLFAPMISFACAKDAPNVKIHCDVNKTIICTDGVQGKELAETVDAVQAEFTFAKWDGKTEQSYYNFVTTQLKHDQPELSPTSEEFKKKRGQLLKNFPHFLTNFPEAFTKYKDDKAKMLALLGAEKTVIFPSFLKLIAWLNTNYKDRYSIYLRTFGKDLPEVIPAIEKKAEIKFADVGQFKGRSLSFPNSLRFANTVALDFFVWSHDNYGLRDDYEYWQSKGYQAEGGKPFPVGLNANDIEIFFDDNADDAVKPIICPVDSKESILDTNELLKKGIIVAVNPKEAILDEDYFINALKRRIAQS